ncbi:MAG: class II SORL domain-containing protein [Candidatus Saliniplasma sp.]
MYQSDDWKTEKHVPVIEVKEKDEEMMVLATVGKEIAHPNTTEHHIRWIELYFHPEGEKFPYQLGKFEFTSHGESTEGPDTSTVYTEPKVKAVFKTEKPGTIVANSYCNIHGLWTNEKDIK